MDVACTDFHPILCVKGISRRHRYAARSPLRSLTRAIERSAPELIVAADDIAIGHLQALRATGRPELAKLIEQSLGPSASYDSIASRARFIAAAQSAGVDAPDCAEIATADGLRGWLREFGAPAFLKLDGTCGGEGVTFVREADEAVVVFASLNRSASRARERAAGAFKASGRAALPRDKPPVISIQKAVAGQPANCSAFAWRGEVLGVISVVTLQTLHPFGIATVVRPVENHAMREAAVAIARELNLSGFFGLDFILQEGGQQAWVLELNPRPTPISHFALGPGKDLVAALISTVEGRARTDRPIGFQPGANIAIFPHLLRGRSAELEQQDDWPVGQPRLVGAFARRRKFAEYRALVRNWLAPQKGAATPVELTRSSGTSRN